MSARSLASSPKRGRSSRSAPPDDARVPLRLSVTRGTLGLELYEPLDVGPLEVTALELTFPKLSFPLDLSGGVPEFRHRRGDLERLELTLGLERLAQWLAPRLRPAFPALEVVRVWATDAGLGVGLTSPDAALACELLWAPSEGDARWVVSRARSAGLGGPALGTALRLLDTALAKVGERTGRVIRITELGQRLTRVVLPAVGARAPAAGRVRCGALVVTGDRVALELDAGFASPELGADVVRALELAELTARADDALAAGALDAARAAYVAALERAPRHPEIVLAIAELDALAPDRAEAALGLLVEVMPALQGGAVAAELLARVGDLDGARLAAAEAARHEVYGPVAALFYRRLAELEPDARARLAALDVAVARAPGHAAVRWARLMARARAGDVEGAWADAQHLEAAASGARARHEACLRAGRLLLDLGYARAAARAFERALRYVPDDPRATAGLARGLVATGRTRRALGLFERAISLGEGRADADPDASLDLALLLAQELRDLPAAIARAREVTVASPRVIEARAHEARWRAALGDLAGAALAYARLRDAIELAHPPEPAWARWLLEAARLASGPLEDPVAAERYLAVALRLAPHDGDLQRAYRNAAAVLITRQRAAREPALVVPAAASAAPSAAAPSAGAASAAAPSAGALSEAAPSEATRTARPPSEAAPPSIATDASSGTAPNTPTDAPRPGLVQLEDWEQESGDEDLDEDVERLQGALRADPDASEVALRLVALLERLGRDAELLALLSARLDDAEPAERERLLPSAFGVLERLAAQARGRGREREAEVYDGMLRRLRPP